MNNKELQDLLRQYPDDTPVMITILTKRNGELSCLEFNFAPFDLMSGKTKCIELTGETEDV